MLPSATLPRQDVPLSRRADSPEFSGNGRAFSIPLLTSAASRRAAYSSTPTSKNRSLRTPESEKPLGILHSVKSSTGFTNPQGTKRAFCVLSFFVETAFLLLIRAESKTL
jgi:hypothetical protein